MQEIIAAGVLFLIAVFAFAMSVRSFQEKGFLFNNAYLYASRQERDSMNKKPYYRQSGIVFLMIGFVFLLNGLSALLQIGWISYLAGAIIIATLVYAIVSTIAIDKKN